MYKNEKTSDCYDSTRYRLQLAPGQYLIKVGASSQDIRLTQPVTLKGEKIQKPLREFYFSETF